MAAAVLCLTTFESQCEGQWVTHFIDNNMALGNVISGASQAVDANALENADCLAWVASGYGGKLRR